MYIYEDHMGGLYTSDRELNYEEIHCEQCGDTDWLIGCATTKEDAWKLLKYNMNVGGCGGWDYDYIQAFIDVNWNN